MIMSLLTAPTALYKDTLQHLVSIAAVDPADFCSYHENVELS
jgi:hypothetical protein